MYVRVMYMYTLHTLHKITFTKIKIWKNVYLKNKNFILIFYIFLTDCFNF